jgi:aldehyde:ferredoxin oxidoreductase
MPSDGTWASFLSGADPYAIEIVNNDSYDKPLSSVGFNLYTTGDAVTVKEYESRVDRYDTQMKEKIGVDPVGKTTEEKIAITRKFREEQYEKLLDAVYSRRGWTKEGIPTIEHLKNIGMDLPEVIEVVKPYLK